MFYKTIKLPISTGTQASTRRGKRRRRRRWPAPLGFAIFVFALIGLFYVIFLSVQTYQDITDNSPEKEMFEKFIEPVVLVDFPPFEDVSLISSVKALEAAMWATMNSGNEGENFAVDDNNRMIIPTDIIMENARALFGKDIELKFVDFGEVDAMFEYDSETDSYHAPVREATSFYIPVVESIKRKRSTYILKVGYVSSNAPWAEDKDGNKIPPEPEKHMTYELTRVKASKSGDKADTYYISSIKKAQ